MSATATHTREGIRDFYDHDLPEEMGAGPFDLFAIIDVVTDSEGRDRRYPCTVAVAGGYAFCLTCEAQGHLDGYCSDADGVESWHRSL